MNGMIERITYHNPDNGYCVFRLKVSGFRDLVTIVGAVDQIVAGEDCQVEGVWVENREYGRQFKASAIKTVLPDDPKQLIRALGSGMIKGVGPHIAQLLVTEFGKDVFDIIENNIDKIAAIKGIGAKRAQMISESWQTKRAIRTIMIFLQSHNISTSRAMRIYKQYGENAIAVVRNNPYKLARDISGIGFKSADTIAQSLGLARDSIDRAKAGLEFLLWSQTNQGHCAFVIHELIQQAHELLEIEEPRLKQGLEMLLKEQVIVFEHIDNEACVFPTALHKMEIHIAQKLHALQAAPFRWKQLDSSALDFKISQFERQHGITFAPHQTQAIRAALTNKVTIITGGPGTGKSTLTQAITHILRAQGVQTLLASPTGKAAKRLASCTGMEAKTIHRLLKYDPETHGFVYNENNPLKADLVLLDEVSMLDVMLASKFLKAISEETAIIFVGDHDQLPSVGPGRFFGDLLDCHQFTTVKLTQIFRQAKGSKIIETAHSVNQGKMPNLQHEAQSDFYFIECEDNEKIPELVVSLVKERIPQKFGFNPFNQIQVLSPMQKGAAGVRNLNQLLQSKLNENPGAVIQSFGIQYGLRDKVMVTANDYEKEVFNGDTGIISRIDTAKNEVEITIDERLVVFDVQEMDIISLAYAMSVHKSQGSEYPAVVIPVTTAHYMLLQRNLIYTALTRGKRLVVCVGQTKALRLAIQNLKNPKRWTNLKKRFQDIGNQQTL
jgi:exodeoxyribonuclease V alpha subunit